MKSSRKNLIVLIISIIIFLLILIDLKPFIPRSESGFSYLEDLYCIIIKQGTYEKVKPGESNISEHIGMYACDYVSKGKVNQ
jgi:hypothetical protein